MKKNLKAIVSIILVLGLLVCLTGCGENEKKQEAIDEFTPPPPRSTRSKISSTPTLPRFPKTSSPTARTWRSC